MNLFQIITIMAFFMLLPVTVCVEGLPILPQNLAAAVSDGLADVVEGIMPEQWLQQISSLTHAFALSGQS